MTTAGSNHPDAPDHHDNASAGSASPITLPQNVSRHFHAPEDCFAIRIPDVVTPEECEALIRLGAAAPAGRGRRGFDYITEAMHTAPDGTQHPVKLQNPNPHKLSVFDHPSSVDMLWERLRPALHQSKDFRSFLHREGCESPTGLNPRLRVLKYDASDNDEFRPHYDATTRIGDHTSLITVLLYLNTGSGADFEGGETLYLDASVQQDPTGYNHLTKTKRHRKGNEKDNMGIADITGTMGGRRGENENENENENANRGLLGSKAMVVSIPPASGTCILFEHDLYHSGAPLQWGSKYVLRTDVLFHQRHALSNTASTKRGDRINGTNNIKSDGDGGNGGPRGDDGTDGDGDGDSHIADRGDKNGDKCERRSPTDYATMKELCDDLISRKQLMTIEERDAMAGLGLVDVSVEGFCAPGRFYLHQMLQECGFENIHAITTLLDIAFDCAKNRKQK